MALEPAPTRALTSSVRGPLGRSSQPLRRACPSHAIDFLRPSGRDPGRVVVERPLRFPELPVRLAALEEPCVRVAAEYPSLLADLFTVRIAQCGGTMWDVGLWPLAH